MTKLTQNDRTDIIAAIQSGKTPKELAGICDISSSSIGEVYRKGTGKGVLRLGKLSQRNKEAVVAELQSGKTTIQELSRRYDVGHLLGADAWLWYLL